MTRFISQITYQSLDDGIFINLKATKSALGIYSQDYKIVTSNLPLLT